MKNLTATLTLKENPDIFIFQATLGNTPMTTPDGWLETPLAHLTRQFTDNTTFWADH